MNDIEELVNRAYMVRNNMAFIFEDNNESLKAYYLGNPDETCVIKINNGEFKVSETTMDEFLTAIAYVTVEVCKDDILKAYYKS